MKKLGEEKINSGKFQTTLKSNESGDCNGENAKIIAEMAKAQTPLTLVKSNGGREPVYTVQAPSAKSGGKPREFNFHPRQLNEPINTGYVESKPKAAKAAS